MGEERHQPRPPAHSPLGGRAATGLCPTGSHTATSWSLGWRSASEPGRRAVPLFSPVSSPRLIPRPLFYVPGSCVPGFPGNRATSLCVQPLACIRPWSPGAERLCCGLLPLTVGSDRSPSVLEEAPPLGLAPFLPSPRAFHRAELSPDEAEFTQLPFPLPAHPPRLTAPLQAEGGQGRRACLAPLLSGSQKFKRSAQRPAGKACCGPCSCVGPAGRARPLLAHGGRCPRSFQLRSCPGSR